MKRSCSKGCKVAAAIVLVGMGRAQATYQWDGLCSSGIGSTLIGGSTVLGAAIGTTGSTSGGSTAVMVVIGLFVALSGTTASTYLSDLSKELVVQLKVDHDTYLAGGGRTPFLEEVCRGLLLRTKAYSVEDPRTGRESIDEQKLTSAIDQLVEMAEKGP